MKEINEGQAISSDIGKKIIKAFFSLTLRKVIIDSLSFAVIYLYLAKMLPVEVIGIYGIATSVLGFFMYFSDIGLAGALIQKKEVSNADLHTTFIIQEAIAVIIAAIVWISAPYIANFYHFDIASMWLIRALGVAFLLTSLKVIPTVLLERQLKFGPIVFVDIAETAVFLLVLVFLTSRNAGVEAYTYAVLLRGLAGLLIFALAPWKIGFGFSKSSVKDLVNFGIPFQLNSFLALLKDRLTPLITAGIVGQAGMGYLIWAEGIVSKPLEIMSIVNRITFPAFSRLQSEKEGMKDIIEKSVFLTTFIVYPLVFGIAAIAFSLINYIGLEKWGPALYLIYLYAFARIWAVPSTVYTNVLWGIGKTRINLYLMVMWTALTWGLSPLFALLWGYTGVAIAQAVIAFSSLIPIIIVNRMFNISFAKNIAPPVVASFCMMVVTYVLSRNFGGNLPALLGIIVFGALLYLGIVALMAKERVISGLKTLRNV